MTFLGILGIRDDIRPEAVKAIEEVMTAGIQVIMITGDRKETAMAIAKDSGLLTSDKEVVLTSDELQTMSDEEIKKVLPDVRVIARALPMDKFRLVGLAQELGLAPNKLSFHLKSMSHAGVVTVEQEGRFQRYRANLPVMLDVIAYLTEECCSGHPEQCETIREQSCCSPAVLPPLIKSKEN